MRVSPGRSSAPSLNKTGFGRLERAAATASSSGSSSAPSVPCRQKCQEPVLEPSSLEESRRTMLT